MFYKIYARLVEMDTKLERRRKHKNASCTFLAGLMILHFCYSYGSIVETSGIVMLAKNIAMQCGQQVIDIRKIGREIVITDRDGIDKKVCAELG